LNRLNLVTALEKDTLRGDLNKVKTIERLVEEFNERYEDDSVLSKAIVSGVVLLGHLYIQTRGRVKACEEGYKNFFPSVSSKDYPKLSKVITYYYLGFDSNDDFYNGNLRKYIGIQEAYKNNVIK
jgi:hypothetical protein